MSFRANAQGQIESVKFRPDGTEHVSVIIDRQEIVDALNKANETVAEVTADLADYDTVVAAQAAPPPVPAPTPEVPAAPAPEVPAPAVPETPAPPVAAPETPAAPAPNPEGF